MESIRGEPRWILVDPNSRSTSVKISAYKRLGEKTILDKSTPNKIIRGCVLYTRLSHALHLSGQLNKWFLVQPPRQENLMRVF